jgi:branched-chain amino acid transport system substrate-binding protein
MEMFRKLIFLAFCVLPLAVLGFQGLASGEEPIKIGWLGDLSGPLGSYGAAIRRGSEFAVEEVNSAGGVKGKKLELIYRDSRSMPNLAADLVNGLIKERRVVAILGDVSVGSSLVAAEVSLRYKVPQVAFLRSPLFEKVKSSYLFSYFPSQIVYYNSIVGYAARVLNLEKFAIMLTQVDEDRGVSKLIEGYISGIRQGKIVSKKIYDPLAGDFKNLIQQVRSVKPDAVFLFGPPNVTGVIAKEIKDMGWQVNLLSVDFSGGLKQFLDNAGPAAGDVWISSAFAADKFRPDFVAKWTVKFRFSPDYNNVIGYDTLKILSEGISKVGVDPSKLQEVLTKERFSTVAGIPSVSPAWEIDKMFIKQWKAGILATVAEYGFSDIEKNIIQRQRNGGVLGGD